MTQLLLETDTTLTGTACGWKLHTADLVVVEEEVDIVEATAEAMVEEDTEEDSGAEVEVGDALVHHPEDQTIELWCQVRLMQNSRHLKTSAYTSDSLQQITDKSWFSVQKRRHILPPFIFTARVRSTTGR